MCAYLKRQCLYDVSIGVVRELEFCQEKDAWLNDNDRAYGTMCLAIPPTMRYLLDSDDYAFKIWINLDESLGMQQQDVSYMETNKISTSLCVLPMISASCISQEVVRNEEEEVVKDSTKDTTQFSSSMAYSPCQEDMFHEDRI